MTGLSRCPCCGEKLADIPCDAPFCWDCGLYARDHKEECDNPEHGQPGVKLSYCGVGWPA